MPVLAGVHPIREALRANRKIERLLVAKGAENPRIREIIDICRERGISLRVEDRTLLDRQCNGAVHQGVVAIAAAHSYATLESVMEDATMLVVLDGVEDPHNLGAIVRTAHAAGANAVIIPERRAAGMSETVAKAAAGALEWLPLVRISNVSQALDKLKRENFWIYGFDERGKQNWSESSFDARSVIVLGNEGAGLHEHVRKRCDFLLRIPMAGEVASLNVSVTAGIALFEWRRQQLNK
jgi:23S rRNA (guanosine2251-2'-O)-methyltransferase